MSMVWKLLAWLALGLYAGTVAAIFILALRNPALTLLAWPTFTVLLYALWLAFSRSGRKRYFGYGLLAVSATALVVEFYVFVNDSANLRWIAGIAILAGLYAVAVYYLRRHYWRMRRLTGQAGAVRFRHPFLLINPKSGNGRAIRAQVDKLAASQGIDVHILQPGEDMAGLARQAVRRGADVLGVSGGDGSIGAIARVALDYDMPLVVLPGGTRCHFARDVGLRPEAIADSLAGFTGVERRIDVGDINGRIFMNNVSFGAYADIVSHPAYREHKSRVTRQVLRQIACSTEPPYELRFRLEGRRFKQAVTVLVGINRYNTIDALELGRRDRLDGGILHAIAITKLDDQLIRSMLRSMQIAQRQGRTALPHVHQSLVKTFSLTAPGRVAVGVDGELEGYISPVRVRVLPGALRLCVPAEGVRSRPMPTFGRAMTRQLWRRAAH